LEQKAAALGEALTSYGASASGTGGAGAGASAKSATAQASLAPSTTRTNQVLESQHLGSERDGNLAHVEVSSVVSQLGAILRQYPGLQLDVTNIGQATSQFGQQVFRPISSQTSGIVHASGSTTP